MKSLRAKCKAHRIAEGTVRSRMKRGVSLRAALTLRPGPSGNRGPETTAQIAQAAGLALGTVAARKCRGASLTAPIPYAPDAKAITLAAKLAGMNPQTIRRRVRKYGLTVEEAVSYPKDSKCQSCGKVAVLQTDHDHKRKRLRGWLCWGCNSAIGKLGDDVAGIERALAYLKRTDV